MGHGPEAANGPDDTVCSERPKAAKGRWQFAVKNAQLLLLSGAKVDLNNKIGEPPQGWFRDLALALQRGIASEAPAAPARTTEFEAAAPVLFARARASCGFPRARYTSTMGLQDGQVEPSLLLVGSSAASGKSGAFFLLSPDQQCIAKSCTKEDWQTLLQILPVYVERLEAARVEANCAASVPGINRREREMCSGFAETLLPRYLGLYTVTGLAENPEPLRVLVMANVFSGSRRISRRYDLKGSTVGRMAGAKERKKANPVYKDLDWVNNEAVIALCESSWTRIINALTEDVNCLKNWGLMDYSLLLGIHDQSKEEESKPEAMNVVYVQDKSRLCYLGIVDILTPYGWRKWGETMVKGRLSCGSDISCQHPRLYGDRFLHFINDSVFSCSE